MDQSRLSQLLVKLIATWENEVVEFKQASNDYSTDKIGEYFSALANEANLRGVESAWLVFGVNNKTRCVVGSDYRPHLERAKLMREGEITRATLLLLGGHLPGPGSHSRHRQLQRPDPRKQSFCLFFSRQACCRLFLEFGLRTLEISVST